MSTWLSAGEGLVAAAIARIDAVYKSLCPPPSAKKPHRSYPGASP
jgi:hypothetical protein